ncbi:3'-5' exoribonuclease YhaM family protein [Spiroplasma turonicum]|uniref:3'-5' exoribonuclease YhaM n=1 Tax=Spiroplasma turonicum TaxID=216946 RepID=A0A0K1P565_9MOLU|nr:HD domain-containing protein [Spiroplasma turonicum]AKU79456.1 3'-5' exoribonuclease YhaM [Spiroplasma turonicum]ALX70478.1 3'-5' exoribonuclease YhaM [Spiroplasma turonicum]
MISDLNLEEKIVNLTARIERVVLSTGNNGLNYLIVHLIDRTGRIEARLWNVNDEDIAQLKSGSIVRLEANINSYRHQLQLKINNYVIIQEEEFDDYKITHDMFSINAPLNIDDKFKDLIAFIENIKNESYKQITIRLLKKYEEEFKTFPAAVSIHHNVIGGLFWHSTSLLEAAVSLRKVYSFIEVDWELVYCGAILHDLGKVFELDGKNASEYTTIGKLIGHISIGNNFICNAAKELKLDGEDVLKLQHVVLSSHGKNEFGSPVEPLLIESIIISSLDSLDARLYRVNEEIKKVSHNNWTPRILSEDGRSFLRHYNKSKKN